VTAVTDAAALTNGFTAMEGKCSLKSANN
jgi:hypothetical protein